jgi:dTMP kinase
MPSNLVERPVWERFIVFEGLDGAGTTTQAKLIAALLQNGGSCAELTCEPTSYPTGKAIRTLLARDAIVDPKTLAYLFAADRNEHLFNPVSGIAVRLGAGCTVVCDRYLFSSLAYQGREVPDELVGSLKSRFPLPEQLVFIDAPVNLAEQRRQDRTLEQERHEHIRFQERVYRRYQEILSQYETSAMKIHRIDGTGTVDEVHERIASALVRVSSRQI